MSVKLENVCRLRYVTSGVGMSGDSHTYVWCPLLRYLQWVWRVLLRVEVDCVPICI